MTGDEPVSSEIERTPRRKFKAYPIGYFPVDIADVQTAEGKLRLFVAIERTSKFAFVELPEEGGKMITAQFLRNLVAVVPYAIHIVHPVHQSRPPRIRLPPHLRPRMRRERHRASPDQGEASMDQRQVEGMNRTIKEANVKRYHHDSHDQLRQHLGDFVAAYIFGRRLKTLKGLTPCEAICKAWQNEPARFTSNLHDQSPGSDTQDN